MLNIATYSSVEQDLMWGDVVHYVRNVADFETQCM